jgi:hypothetical protein
MSRLITQGYGPAIPGRDPGIDLGSDNYPFIGSKCDIWYPVRQTDNHVTINPYYDFIYIQKECLFQEVDTTRKIMLGMDVAKDFRHVYINGPLIQSLDPFFIVYDLDQKTSWKVVSPTNHWTYPIEHWKAFLELLKAPPAEIALTYTESNPYDGL